MDKPSLSPDSLKQDKGTKVSYYSRITSTAGTSIEVSEICDIIRDGKDFKNIIAALRNEHDARKADIIKKKLPAITWSGIFNKERKLGHLAVYSRLICLDFDKLSFIPNAFKRLCSDPFVYILFISPSGKGLKIVVKVSSDASQHSEAFKSLESYFRRKYNLQADPHCKDVTRLCFLTYDPNIYINEKAEVFSVDSSIPQSVKETKTINSSDSLPSQVETIVREIEEQKLDITRGYSNWLKLGFALADGLGEFGREYFHRLSIFDPQYNRNEADKQFSACLKGDKNGYTIRSFFQLAKNNGIPVRKSDIVSNSNNAAKQEISTLKDNIPLITRVENFLNERYEFRRNIVNEKLESRPKDCIQGKWNTVNENAVSRLLQKNHFRYSPRQTLELLNSDFVGDYNPFIDYFESLACWSSDTEPSYIDKLTSLVKAKDQKRFNVQFKKMLIRCVACAVVTEQTNENFNKHVFVLVNANQSSGKSTLCRWLCPSTLKEYYVENITFDKDGNIALAQSFLINLDELATLKKPDIDQLKTFISKASVNERLPYGRSRKFYPRRANFVGSTNNLQFLTDETGNVRWICSEIEEINFGYNDPTSEYYVPIDRLWAEAYDRFKAGEEWQLTTRELMENEISNQIFKITCPEEELLVKCFEPAEKLKEFFMTNTDIMGKFATNGHNTNQLSQRKLGEVLRKLRFPQGQQRIGKIPVYGYYLKETENCE